MAAHKYWRLKDFWNNLDDVASGVKFRGLSLHTSYTGIGYGTMLTTGITAVVTGSSSADNALGNNVLEHNDTTAKSLTGADTVITITLATAADVMSIGLSVVGFDGLTMYGFTVEYSDDNVNWTYAGSPNLQNSRPATFAPNTIMPLQLPRKVSVTVTGGASGDVYEGVLYPQGAAAQGLNEWSAVAGIGGALTIEVEAYGPPTYWTFIAQHQSDTTKNAQALSWIYA